MRNILFGVCLLFVTSKCRQSGPETINYRSYLMLIKLYLKNEEISELVVKSIFGNHNVLSGHFRASKISLDDLIEVAESSDAEVKKVLLGFDIKFDPLYQSLLRIEWDSKFLEDLLTFVTIKTVSEAYSRFQHIIFVDIKKLFVDLSIDSGDFRKAIMEENPQKVIQALSKGNYTRSNIENQLNILNPNLSLSNALKFLKCVKLDEVVIKLSNNVKTRHLIDTFKQLFTKCDPLRVVEVLNLRAHNFYENAAFADFLKHVTNFNYKVIGTPISDSKIITFLYDDFLKYHTRLVAETFDNPSIQYDIDEIVYEHPNTATLVTKQKLVKYVAPAKIFNREDLKHCAYLTETSENVLQQEIYTSELNSNKVLYVNKTNGTSFSLGSPLLCGGYLYGIANWGDEDCIEFVPVYEGEGESFNFLSILIKLVNFLIFTLFVF